MGTRFRRSFKVAPGVRVNLNKKSASISFGPKGLKHTVSTTGKSHTTVGIPGTGLSYTTSSGGKSGAQQGAVSIPAAQQRHRLAFRRRRPLRCGDADRALLRAGLPAGARRI